MWRRPGGGRGLTPPRREREILQFRAPPPAQSLGKLLAQPKIGDEPVVEFAPTGINLTEASGGGAILGQSNETPPIKFHERRRNATRPALERQMRKRALGIAINWANEPGLITRDVE